MVHGGTGSIRGPGAASLPRFERAEAGPLGGMFFYFCGHTLACVACNATRASCFFSFQSCPRQHFQFFAALESATHTTAGLLFEEPYLWSARLHSVLGQRNDCRTRALRLTDLLLRLEAAHQKLEARMLAACKTLAP